jgi:hypothetical protein
METLFEIIEAAAKGYYKFNKGKYKDNFVHINGFYLQKKSNKNKQFYSQLYSSTGQILDDKFTIYLSDLNKLERINASEFIEIRVGNKNKNTIDGYPPFGGEYDIITRTV